MWIIREGWVVREILNSLSRPNVVLGEREALFEVPPGFQGCVGDDVRFFEDSGEYKRVETLVKEGLVEKPPRPPRVPRKVKWARAILAFLGRRVLG